MVTTQENQLVEEEHMKEDIRGGMDGEKRKRPTPSPICSSPCLSAGTTPM
jgi:hypothetical protein